MPRIVTSIGLCLALSACGSDDALDGAEEAAPRDAAECGFADWYYGAAFAAGDEEGLIRLGPALAGQDADPANDSPDYRINLTVTVRHARQMGQSQGEEISQGQADNVAMFCNGTFQADLLGGSISEDGTEWLDQGVVGTVEGTITADTAFATWQIDLPDGAGDWSGDWTGTPEG